MLESTAQAREQEELESQTRTSGQERNLQVGKFVGILRKTERKGITNWSGPFNITDISDQRDGIIHAKWQGQPMSVRLADIRRAMFLEFLHFASGQESSITGIITCIITGISTGSSMDSNAGSRWKTRRSVPTTSASTAANGAALIVGTAPATP